MRRILSSRLFRSLICLILVCCILVLSSPIRAKATGLVEGLVIAGASVVNVPAALVTVATLICLGLMADATAQNPFLLQDIANSCQEHLAATGTLIKDGTVELLRCVTATGEAIYYVGNNFMEAVRSWLFSPPEGSAVVYSAYECLTDLQYASFTDYLTNWCAAYPEYAPHIMIVKNGSLTSPYGTIYVSRWPFILDSDGLYRSYYNGYSQGFNAYLIKDSGVSVIAGGVKSFPDAAEVYSIIGDLSLVTDFDLTLGIVPTVPIDGTSARAWSEEYANRGLYVVPGSGTGGNEGQDGSWFWPLALTLSIAELLAMIQAEQWISQTPPEFDDYTTEEELEVTPAPEFEGYPSIEVSPAPNPNPNPGGTPGTGDDTDPNPTEVPNPGVTPNPGTGTDTDTDTEETKWFQRIITGIEELPSKFGQWFTDVKTSIQEIPTKFATYFENVTTAIQEIPSKFQSWIGDLKTAIEAVPAKVAETVAEVKAAIQAIPDAIVSGIESLLGSDSSSGSSSWTPPSDHTQFQLVDLKNFFPFCIPFDLFKFFELLHAEPVAPVLYWEMEDLAGQTYSLSIDLSKWDSVAQLFRRLQLFLFICGLAAASRKFIKW